MEKAYKFRIYPTEQQIILMNKNFACVRYLYNHYLALQMDLFKTQGKHMSFYDMCSDLTSLKKEQLWLREADSRALVNALWSLDYAYKRYFLEMKKPDYVKYSSKKLKHFKEVNHTPTQYDSAWHPKFKKRYNYSYKTTCDYDKDGHQSIAVKQNYVKLPKLGWIYTKNTYQIDGKIVNANVYCTSTGKYYVSISCINVSMSPLPKTFRSIGIDVGMNNYCTLSNGEKIINPHYFISSQEEIDKLHKELSRKTVNGSNWNKTRIKLAKAYEKMTNQTEDFIHKLTTRLVQDYDIICVEDISIDDMIRNIEKTNRVKANKRNRIYDCSWGKFFSQLEYKAKWYGKTLCKVSRWFPSSQICNICGYQNVAIKDCSIREWVCPQCGTHHDRDVNAAINILNKGLEQLSNNDEP